MRPVELKSFVVESGSEIVQNADEGVLMEVDTAGGISKLDDMQSMETELDVPRARDFAEHARKYMHNRKFSFEHYKTIKIISNVT